MKLGTDLFKTYPLFLSPLSKSLTICSFAYKPIKDLLLKTHDNPDSDTPTINSMKSNLYELGVIKDFNKACMLMLTKGFSIYNKVILNIFTDQESEPSYIVKIPRTKESALPLANEARILLRLQENYQSIKGIPKVLFTEETIGFGYIGETFICGQPINKVVMKNNFHELALKATEFLVELCTKTKENAAHDSWDKLVKPILSEFVSNFGSILDPKLMKQTIELINGLELKYLVLEHSDYSPWNLLINPEGELGVLDWEDSYFRGLPVIDLVYFMAYLSHDLKEAEPALFVESYRKMLDVSSFTGRIFKECLDYYSSEIGIPSSSIPRLRLLTWLGVINWNCHLISNYEDHAPTKDSLLNILQIGLWEEEIICSREYK